MLLREEDILVPPWDQDHNQDMSQKFGNMMRGLGYSVEDDDMTKGMQDRGLASPDKSQVGFYKRKVDPFECLKQDVDDSDSVDHSSFSSLKPKEFSVSDWTKRSVENYKEFVTQSVHPLAGRTRRVKSAMPRMQGNHVHYGSRNAWDESNNDHQSDSPVRSHSAFIRPHTASGTPRHRVQNELSTRRPNSAGRSSFNGHVSPGDATQKNETRTRSETNSGSDTNKSGIDQVDELDGDVFEDSTHNDNEPSVETHSSEHLARGKQSLPLKSHSRSTASSSSIRNRNSMTSSGGSLGSTDRKDMQRQTSYGTETTQRPELKLSTRDSKFLLGTVLNADGNRASKSSKVTFSDEKEVDGQTKTPRAVKSVEHLVKLTKDSSKLADYDIDKLGADLEDISGLKHDHVDDLFKKMPQNRNQRTRQQVMLSKAERRITIHSQPRRRPSTMDPLQDILDSDDEEDDENGAVVHKMPQWKRELMAEAPPGLFGPKSPTKVVVAMSKSQRKRELDALVTDNVSDKKKIIEHENARRIRSRLHMYFTMRKLSEAAETISGDAECS